MPNLTLDAASLQAIINTAVAAALKGQGKGGKSQPAKPVVVSTMGKTERQIAIEKAVVTAFKRAGFGTVVPRVDVRTFGRWVEAGFVPKKGEKATKVKQFRLFHVSQVELATQTLNLGLSTVQPKAENEPAREEIEAASSEDDDVAQLRAEIDAFVAEQRGKPRLIPAPVPPQQSKTAEIPLSPNSEKPTLHIAPKLGDDIPF